MVAGAVMAMFAMVASVTYQHHGFFTPLLHISALFGSPAAMMRSVSEAMTGNRFWFTAGPAALGLLIHMMTAAMFGIGFVLVARRIRRAALVPAGGVYGESVRHAVRWIDGDEDASVRQPSVWCDIKTIHPLRGGVDVIRGLAVG